VKDVTWKCRLVNLHFIDYNTADRVKKSVMPTGLKANDFRHESGTQHLDSKEGKIEPVDEDLIF
jgi:hypothetical protein